MKVWYIHGQGRYADKSQIEIHLEGGIQERGCLCWGGKCSPKLNRHWAYIGFLRGELSGVVKCSGLGRISIPEFGTSSEIGWILCSGCLLCSGIHWISSPELGGAGCVSLALVRARVFLRCPFSQYSTQCSPAAPQVRAEGSLSPRAQDQPEQPSKTYPAKKKRGFLILHLGSQRTFPQHKHM